MDQEYMDGLANIRSKAHGDLAELVQGMVTSYHSMNAKQQINLPPYYQPGQGHDPKVRTNYILENGEFFGQFYSGRFLGFLWRQYEKRSLTIDDIPIEDYSSKNLMEIYEETESAMFRAEQEAQPQTVGDHLNGIAIFSGFLAAISIPVLMFTFVGINDNTYNKTLERLREHGSELRVREVYDLNIES